jgi:hypothetical protein
MELSNVKKEIKAREEFYYQKEVSSNSDIGK